MKKNITLLDRGEYSERSMIGTILEIENTPDGLQDFKERVDKALAEHFDSDAGDFVIHGINEAFNAIMVNGAHSEFHLSCEHYNGVIDCLETWLY